MNIRDAILEGQKTNCALQRKQWNHKTCIYHRTDNMFYWFSKDGECEIPNKTRFNFFVADLLADDWKVTGLLSYHGDELYPEISDEKENDMKKFEQELERKCFGWGAGGLYFKEHYEEAKRNPNAVQEALESLIEMIEDDLIWEPEPDEEKELWAILEEMPKDTFEDILAMFERYFDTCASFQAYPELIGTLIGGLAYHQRYQLAHNFIGLDNVEAICWDS